MPTFVRIGYGWQADLVEQPISEGSRGRVERTVRRAVPAIERWDELLLTRALQNHLEGTKVRPDRLLVLFELLVSHSRLSAEREDNFTLFV